MSQKIKTTLFQALPAIVIATLLVVTVIYAWTEPSQTPPGGNVAAPINVGSVTQYKSGALGIGGLFRAYSDAIFDGKVGIGNPSPAQKLDVTGQIHATGDICTDVNGKCLSTTGGSVSETDPTVIASVKDGVSWSEISGRPAGLDDGDQVGITSEQNRRAWMTLRYCPNENQPGCPGGWNQYTVYGQAGSCNEYGGGMYVVCYQDY